MVSHEIQQSSELITDKLWEIKLSNSPLSQRYTDGILIVDDADIH